jgi:hypothetical protein
MTYQVMVKNKVWGAKSGRQPTKEEAVLHEKTLERLQNE